MITLPQSLRIGVLRGGPSPEYDASLQSGANALKILGETHRPLDIFVSREGIWHMGGIERSPERVLKNVDVVLNSLYGPYGEDGGVQKILADHGIPHTGADKFSSAIASNKFITKDRAKLLEIQTPISFIIRQENEPFESAKRIWADAPHPFIVKPAVGRSDAVFKVDSFSDFLDSIENILSKSDSIIVEEYISGKDISCFITNNFRDEKLYNFPVKGNLTKQESWTVASAAKKIHDALGLPDFSKSDFVVSPKRGTYFLETNTQPKFHSESHLIEALDSVGVTLKEFLHHIIHLAVYKTGVWL